MDFTHPVSPESRSWLRVLGLHRKELRAWAMYDWASSAFATTIMAAVLPIYYHEIAATGLPENVRTAYWGYTQTVALVIAALLSPVLGAAADYLAAKKKFLVFFVLTGIIGSALLSFVHEGEWLFASLAFVLGNIGFAASEVFYASLLPHIAGRSEINRVSTAGYAIGYVGGGLLLTLQLAWILQPESFGLLDSSQASRLAFASVAVWWGLFTIPILRHIDEPVSKRETGVALRLNPVRVSFRMVIATFREIRRHRQVFLFLTAFWLYNDGINTFIKMATIYGTEIGIGQGHLLGALLLVQFLGVPCTFAYGVLADRWGTKNGIYLALVCYIAISILGYFITDSWHFWALACAVAAVQGGSQALSRSLFATLIPPSKSSQFFGFYSVSGKFGNIIGPFVFALVSQFTGSSRLSILTLTIFFLSGIFLLTRVDVDNGHRNVLATDRALQKAD